MQQTTHVSLQIYLLAGKKIKMGTAITHWLLYKTVSARLSRFQSTDLVKHNAKYFLAFPWVAKMFLC